MESTNPIQLAGHVESSRRINECGALQSTETPASPGTPSRSSRKGRPHVETECDARKAIGGNLHTLPEVAKFLRVSVKTIRRLIDEGKLKIIKVRGAVRVWDRDLAAYLQKLAA